MQTEEMSAIVFKHTEELAALTESVKSAHKRITENDKITTEIHSLAKSVAEMATEIKLLTKRVDSSIERIEQGQKAQGERIGNIEKVVLSIERNEKTLEDHEKRLDAYDKAPGDKWNKFSWLVITGIATAIIGFLMARLL